MNLLEKARHVAATLKGRGALRKKLRGPADLQYAIAESIGMLNRDAWQKAAAGGGFFMSWEYLSAIERALPGNILPRYALIFARSEDDSRIGAPIAAMVMQAIDISLAQMRPLPASATSAKAATAKLAAPIHEKISAARQRVLACGNFLTFGMHGVAFADDLDKTDLPTAWHGVAEVLYRVRQADKLAGTTQFVLIKDLHAPHTATARLLENLSYRYVGTEPDMVLALDPAWKSYDDYLGGLASTYRVNLRNGVLKPIDEAGCRLEHADDVAPIQDTLYALYLAVQKNASIRPFTLRADYFAALRAAAGEKFHCSILKQDERILGFLMSIADGETSIAYHIGFDRDAAQDLPVYLRLLHAGIADAIDMGCRQVSFGRTALEPKASLGAKPRDFGVLVRHRQPVLNKLIKGLLPGIEHEDAPARNPFKKPK